MLEQPQSSTSFGSQVFMMNGVAPISKVTRPKHYSNSHQSMGKEIVDAPTPSTVPAFGPLHIERHISNPVV